MHTDLALTVELTVATIQLARPLELSYTEVRMVELAWYWFSNSCHWLLVSVPSRPLSLSSDTAVAPVTQLPLPAHTPTAYLGP